MNCFYFWNRFQDQTHEIYTYRVISLRLMIAIDVKLRPLINRSDLKYDCIYIK